jgi:hypothetical protein
VDGRFRFQPLLDGVEEFWGVFGGPPRRASSASNSAFRASAAANRFSNWRTSAMTCSGLRWRSSSSDLRG